MARKLGGGGAGGADWQPLGFRWPTETIYALGIFHLSNSQNLFNHYNFESKIKDLKKNSLTEMPEKQSGKDRLPV